MSKVRAARGIGLLRERVRIQQETEVSDGGGGYTVGWENISENPEVSARIEPLRGFEKLQATGLQGQVTHRVTLRYRTDVNVGNRFLWGTTPLNVQSPGTNDDERRRYMTYLCNEGGAV